MTTSASTNVPADIAEFVHGAMARWHTPGLALGVLRDGQVERWGFGVTSIETRQPVTPDTLFQIGSITKVFTATAIMQLVDEGKVALDAPVRAYLPDFKLADEAAAAAVTVRQLLSHQTGFWGDNFKDFGPGDDALTKALAEFPSLRQWFAPGELWAYCNTAFQVAGAIIERLRAATVEEAIREHVFKPLGLKRTVWYAYEAITYPVAVGHTKLPGKEIEIARPWPLMRCMDAAGAIISTVGDLLCFAAFHLGNGSGAHPLLTEASRLAMQEPQIAASSFADHYGIGWALQDAGSVRLVGHGGSTNGYRARLVLVPERRVAIAILTNGSGGAATSREVERWALARWAGVEQQDPAPVTLTPEQLTRFAGRYEQPLSEMTLTIEGDGLMLRVITRNPWNDTRVEMPPVRVVPLDERRLLVTEGENTGGIIDLILHDDGRVRFLRAGGRLADKLGSD